MDVKISKKEKRTYKTGPVEVLLDNACDLFPLFGNNSLYDNQDIFIGQNKITGHDRENVIMDVEILDADKDELLDRSMFAIMKQRGNDPVEPNDGIQWAEAVLGEVPPPVIMQQAQKAVAEEGPGVKVTSYTVRNGDKETLVFKVDLTNAA